MKTLIIYASKHGCAEKCAKLLRDKINGEVITVNIKMDKEPDINSFDKVIIGGSIYAGRIQNEIGQFCVKNLDTLRNIKIGFFICGMRDGDAAKQQINSSFPQELLGNAVIKESFGGEFILEKLNFMERFIVKKIAKIVKDTSTVSEETINKFAQTINNA